VATESPSRPNPERALNKSGANAFVNYKPSSNLEFDLSLGLQESEVQKNFIGGETPFTTGTTESQYANLAAKIYGLSLRTSYLDGTDNLNINTPPNKYDFNITDISAEYEIKAGEKVTIVPGISYLSSKYNDGAYMEEGLVLYGGEEVSINTTSGFIRTDIKPVKNLRVIAALRADKFSAPDDIYLAYEFAATFKLNEKNLIRAAVTRSNSGSFIGNTYLNFSAPVMPGVDFERKGNEDLDLFQINMIELGYRVQFSNKVHFDIDVFSQKARNFISLQTTGMFSQQFRNVPTTAEQLGTTISLNIVPNENFQVKPFVTLQKTEVRDLPSSYLDPSIDPTLTYSTKDHENTPSFYGGVYVNYKPGKKVNLNVNGYFFSRHRQYDASDLDDNSEAGDISGKAIVNFKVNYTVLKQLNLFFNGRNIFNNSSREFYGTDRIGGVYSLGASFSLN
jgi:iron complex outermembrane recepter protein